MRTCCSMPGRRCTRRYSWTPWPGTTLQVKFTFLSFVFVYYVFPFWHLTACTCTLRTRKTNFSLPYIFFPFIVSSRFNVWMVILLLFFIIVINIFPTLMAHIVIVFFIISLSLFIYSCVILFYRAIVVLCTSAKLKHNIIILRIMANTFPVTENNLVLVES